MMRYLFELHGPYGKFFDYILEVDTDRDAKCWFDRLQSDRNKSMVGDVVIDQPGRSIVIPRDVFDNSIKVIRWINLNKEEANQ